MLEMWYEALWFFGGIITYLLITKLIRYGQMSYLVTETTLQCLLLFKRASEDVAFIRQIKYDHLDALELDDNLIEEIEKIDGQIYKNWKDSAILNFISVYPKKFRNTLIFYDWGSAMKALDDIYNKRG